MKDDNMTENKRFVSSEDDWVNISLISGIKGAAEYCLKGNEVTITLEHVALPEVEILKPLILTTLPKDIIPVREVHEVILMSNGNIGNIIISKEGYMIFESYEKVPDLTSFTMYKSYLK